MACGRPSSSSRKSFLVRLLTICPFLSRTLAKRLTTLTSVEKAGSGLFCSWPGRRMAGRRESADSRLRRESFGDPILLLKDVRDAKRVTMANCEDYETTAVCSRIPG